MKAGRKGVRVKKGQVKREGGSSKQQRAGEWERCCMLVPPLPFSRSCGGGPSIYMDGSGDLECHVM